MTTYRHIRVERYDPISVVVLLDSFILDRSLIVELSDELTAFINECKPTSMLLSFLQVRRFCTEVITVLLRVRKLLLQHQGRIALCDMTDEIHEVFRIMRMDEAIFKIFPSCAEGLAAPA